MRKIVLAALSLGIPAAWAYFAHQWFGWHVVVYPNGDTWKPLSRGWETLWKAWPVLTAGLVLAWFVFLGALWLMAFRQRQLERQLRDDLERSIAQENDRQRRFGEYIEQRLHEGNIELEMSRVQVQAQQQQVADQLQAMQERLDAAEAAAADAERRRYNAVRTSERLRRRRDREREKARAAAEQNSPCPEITGA
jgi:citrate lyase gamma subunit